MKIYRVKLPEFTAYFSSIDKMISLLPKDPRFKLSIGKILPEFAYATKINGDQKDGRELSVRRSVDIEAGLSGIYFKIVDSVLYIHSTAKFVKTAQYKPLPDVEKDDQFPVQFETLKVKEWREGTDKPLFKTDIEEIEVDFGG